MAATHGFAGNDFLLFCFKAGDAQWRQWYTGALASLLHEYPPILTLEEERQYPNAKMTIADFMTTIKDPSMRWGVYGRDAHVITGPILDTFVRALVHPTGMEARQLFCIWVSRISTLQQQDLPRYCPQGRWLKFCELRNEAVETMMHGRCVIKCGALDTGEGGEYKDVKSPAELLAHDGPGIVRHVQRGYCLFYDMAS